MSTRFGTTFGVVERFIKVETHVRVLTYGKSSEAVDKVRKALSGMRQEIGDNNEIIYPSLNSIVTSISSLRHMQTELEGALKPTMIKVLPMLEDINQCIRMLSSGVADGPSRTEPGELTVLLASVILKVLDNINSYDLWCAACVLHPGLSSFSFIPLHLSNASKLRGESLVQRMMSEYQPSISQRTVQPKPKAEITPSGGNLGSASWSLVNKISFITSNIDDNSDEYEKYRSTSLSAEEKYILQHDDGLFQYWLRKQEAFPVLYRVAMRIFISPASSSSIERDFNLLKLIIEPTRRSLKDDIIEALAQVRDEYRALDSLDDQPFNSIKFILKRSTFLKYRIQYTVLQNELMNCMSLICPYYVMLTRMSDTD